MSSENNKVVYVHKDKEGIIRYVGSGTMERAYQTHANSYRGKQYTEFVKSNGKLEVEIVFDGLSKSEAENLERELYDQHIRTILNYRRPVSEQVMTREMFDEHLYYDETSASCLRRKSDVVGGNGTIIVKADSEAGGLSKSSGYYVIRLQGRDFQAHRIVAVLHGLDIAGFVIDHIDRNRANNKISNLRVVTQKENCQNISHHKLSSKNTSGLQGVRYDKVYNRWVADWYENGRYKQKYFPIKNYKSSEEAFGAAVEHRKLMVKLYYQMKE